MCISREDPRILPLWKGLEIPGGGGFPKAKKFKDMYEVELEFSEGWGALRKNPFSGKVWIFYGTTCTQSHFFVVTVHFRKTNIMELV